MALLRPSLDYTDKDFDALRARARNLISSVFPDWTDDNIADFGNILVELFAFDGDVLTAYQDAQARETRWTQAQLRQSLIALTALIGYVPTGATAAVAEETFVLASQASDVVLPAGTRVSTLDVVSPVQYQLLADLTIPAGDTTAIATVENSAFADETFESNALPNQAFSLFATPYLEGSISVEAANGVYTVVRNFLDSGPTSRHVVVRVDSSDRAKIIFGNGVNGAVPSGTISVAHKTGGGVAGRVERNTLKKLVGSFSTNLGIPVTISVNNAEASAGGTDRQSNAQIRLRAPESVRVTDRCIGREDFEIVARAVPGVARALFLTEAEDPGTGINRGILYVVPEGGGDAPASLLEACEAAIAARPTAPTFQYRAQRALYLEVDVFAWIYPRKGYTASQAKAATLAALQAFFALTRTDSNGEVVENDAIDFGFNLKNATGEPEGSLAYSDIYNAVRDVPALRKVGAGVTRFTVNGQVEDLAIAPRAFPRLRSVVLIDGDTGAAL